MIGYPWKGYDRLTWLFQNFTLPQISLEQLKLETSNFVYMLTMWRISLNWVTVPQVGVVHVTRLISTFWTQKISLMQVFGVLVWITPTTVEFVMAECTSLLYIGQL